MNATHQARSTWVESLTYLALQQIEPESET